MSMRITALLAALGGCAAAATAEPVFIAFANTTMYRFTAGGSVETFTLTDKMMSLALAPNGGVFGHSAERNSGADWESYQLIDPLGVAPSLSMLSNAVPGPRATLSYADGLAYSARDGSGGAEFITVDQGTLVDDTLIGLLNIDDGINGSGYDADADVLYGINRVHDALVTVHRGTGNATIVGSLGVDYFNGGAEWYRGTLYAWLQDLGSGNMLFGTVNTGTGEFTMVRDLGAFDPNVTTFMSLTVLPTPATLGLLAMGGLVAGRRRR